MKIQLKCVKKKVLNSGYTEIKFRGGSIEFKLNINEALASKYEIGNNYFVELEA